MSMAACLPEQFIRSREAPPPERRSSFRVAVSPGHASGQPRSSSVRPTLASISRTTAAWRSVPAWLAVDSAAHSPVSVTPAVCDASDWNGFRLERGKISASVLPRLRATVPSGASTMAMPAWRDSMKPLRSATASWTASAMPKVSGTGTPPPVVETSGRGFAPARSSLKHGRAAARRGTLIP
jgi:hypothetical protein